MFPLGLPSGKTLFQLQAERILRLQNLANAKFSTACIIPWYIMTSGATFSKTKRFFEKNNFFGLSADNIFFFEQFQIPSLTTDGEDPPSQHTRSARSLFLISSSRVQRVLFLLLTLKREPRPELGKMAHSVVF